MKVIKITGKSFELWAKNPIIIVPFLLEFLLNILLILPFGIVIFYPNLKELAVATPEAIANIITEKVISSYYMLGWFAAVVILLVFLSCFLLAGEVGLANEISLGRRAKLRHLMEYGKKFWFRYLILSILTVVIISFVLIVTTPVLLAISMLGLNSILIAVIVSIFRLAIILLAIMFIPALVLISVNNSSPLEAIKISFRLSKKNYPSLLGLLLILVVINAIIYFIPVLGELIAFFIINPVLTIALVLFTKDRLEKHQKPAEKKKK